MSTMITARTITVRVYDRTILDGATLSIDDNDGIGLVGRNGSGKTTFLRILSGLLKPDGGEVARRRDLVVGYLPQEFALDAARNVGENIRDGAQHVTSLIAEFEALPAHSKRHNELESRITALEGWSLDQRIATAMAHLSCPDADRRLETLSGGEKRRVAMCRALVSRPDLLLLDEPTNHLDPESIEWIAEFLGQFRGAFLVVTHDRYFLDRVARRIVELADGCFFSHDGNYTDYLLAKAERQAADATIEHKRQMFLKRELAWVRAGVPARRTKAKNRFARYYATAAKAGPTVEEDIELCIPPPPPLGNRIVDLHNLTMEIGGRTLFSNFEFTFENGRRVGVAGRNGLGKTTLLKIIIGHLIPTQGTVKTGPLTRFNYVDQGRLQLDDERTVLEEVSDGHEFVKFGEHRLSLRAYLKRFLFSDDRIMTKVKYLSGGERSRLLLARILKNGGNFLILDEPTNDLDLPTLRVLEETLMAFPGVVCVVSHDRYFLNRVCTDILIFESGGKIVHSVGNYDYYLERKNRSPASAPQHIEAAAHQPAAMPSVAKAPNSGQARKLTFREKRELAGMETEIAARDAVIARIEALFMAPDFYQTHAAQTHDLTAELSAAKEELSRLYARWEELEAIRTTAP